MTNCLRWEGPSQNRLAIAACAVALLASALPVGAQEKIRIDGSTGTAPLVEALGKAFAEKTRVSIEVGKGLGTKERFEALAGGKIDIVMASHGLNVNAIAKRGMVVHPIAKTPVLFAVHETVKVDNLSEAQLCAIYGGRVGSWKDVGGGDQAIAALARPETEVDMEVVRDGISCFKELKLHGGVQIFGRAGELARALSQTVGALGMASATVVAQSRGRVKALSLGGIAADETNVVAGRYRLIRDAFLVTDGAAPDAVKAFIDFVRSDAGAKIIRESRAIAVPSGR
jgi:phosphate transport system substrate-binding protein